MHELLISFDSHDQMIDFCEWFRSEGFKHFIKSKFNGKNSDEISCLATDETPRHSDENFFETAPIFELQ